MAPFPAARPRRLRRTPAMRALVRETRLSADDLIWPLFVRDGEGVLEEVPSMPGVVRRSVDRIVEAVEGARALGIRAVCLFPYTDAALKTDGCEEAWNPDNLSNRATRAIKAACPDVLVMTDVALDPYNARGHDGIVRGGEVVNDESVEALVRQALAQAEAGADVLGPSDMMDGRVAAIRGALEAEGYQHVAIMSYAAKFASGFYGPFRDAVGAAGALTGDKKTYQIDPMNGDEAMRMISRDISEGADMVMVKPGMPYLDLCRRAKAEFNIPVFAYQVSGEYAMIRAAAQHGWIDGEKVMMEALGAFKRAGCDGVLTYFAPEAAGLLARGWE
ncbi:porphobilinogen synthase [Jannaschia sp. W003]|uniref:porphobilinogen synthase n=1 Tax=Jannaschia sp. W003 TaxID=2867012 RepID=UPI0021A73835|nr:porphobilinogen synthase [Jannaschia sp. W003]UWQ21192.1 porphobilinogen synthase [Jannaschia sp. W003]